jgi:hypothetical protein
LPNGAAGPALCTDAPVPPPDGLVSILWSPAMLQPADWLPWMAPVTGPVCAIRYPIYLERSQSQRSVTDIARAWCQTSSEQIHIPVVILQSEDHYVLSYQQLATLAQAPSFRLTTWAALKSGVSQGQWRDEHGKTCGLHPLSESAAN